LWPPLVSLLLFFPSSISDVAAQNLPTETPSVESGPSRRQRADALIAEAENYLFIDNNPSKAYDVALEANLLSQVANYRSGQMRSLLVAGLAKLSLKEGGTAAFLLRAAELIAQDMGNSFLQLEATLATAHMYDFQSKFDELKKVQDRLMFLLLDLGFSPGQAEVYANRGNLDLVRTDQRKSELAARLEAALGQGNLGVATGILRRLAFMHSQKGEFKEALGRLEDWLKLLEPKDTYNRSLALADVGRLERLLGRPEAALQHSDEAVVLFRRLKDRIGEAYGLIGMAEANRDLLKFEDALDESIPLLVEIPKRGPMAVTRRSLAFLGSAPSLAVTQSEGGADAGTP
jgi:tetratricopeptide (TPR) repeat protein